MRSDDVLDVLARLDAEGMSYWVAGGWAVDALAGNETRPHNDLDLLIRSGDLASLELALGEMGFTRADESELPAFLILKDDAGRQIDLYLVQVDPRGDLWQDFSEGKWDYFSAPDVTGVGRIGSREVRCLSAWALFRQFLGYRWSEKARHDLRLLHAKCGTPLPPGTDSRGSSGATPTW